MKQPEQRVDGRDPAGFECMRPEKEGRRKGEPMELFDKPKPGTLASV